MRSLIKSIVCTFAKLVCKSKLQSLNDVCTFANPYISLCKLQTTFKTKNEPIKVLLCCSDLIICFENETTKKVKSINKKTWIKIDASANSKIDNILLKDYE